MTGIRESLELARTKRLRSAWWLVAFSGFTLALPVAVLLARLCHFEYHDSGVIGALASVALVVSLLLRVWPVAKPKPA